MPRVRKGAARSRKHKKILKTTRGQIGAASRRYRVAREAYLRAGQYATIGRKLKKRDFRRLWITRISAACRQRGLSYSRFINALSTSGIAINRKSLADIAVSDPDAFDKIVAAATAAKKPAAVKAPAKPEPAEKPIARPAVEKPAVEKAPPVKETKPAAKKPAAAKKTTTAKAVKKTATKKKTAAKKTTTTKKTTAKKTTTKKTATKKTTAAKTSKKSASAKKNK